MTEDCCRLAKVAAAIRGRATCDVCGEPWEDVGTVEELPPRAPARVRGIRGIQRYQAPGDEYAPPHVAPIRDVPPPSGRPAWKAVVDELLRYADAERACLPPSSWLAGAIVGTVNTEAAVVLGDGCRGTKPLARGRVADPPPPPSAATRARLLALGASSRRTAEAVQDDPYGWRRGPADLRGVPVLEWPLEARVGLALATLAVVDGWARRVLARDSRPVLAAATLAGEVALCRLAEAWT
jgi:hypothetical protein